MSSTVAEATVLSNVRTRSFRVPRRILRSYRHRELHAHTNFLRLTRLHRVVDIFVVVVGGGDDDDEGEVLDSIDDDGAPRNRRGPAVQSPNPDGQSTSRHPRDARRRPRAMTVVVVVVVVVVTCLSALGTHGRKSLRLTPQSTMPQPDPPSFLFFLRR